MKKNILVLTFALTCVLCACGGESSKKIEGEVNTASEQTQEAESTVEEDGASGYKGYAYIQDDVVVEIDADAAPIIEQLGEPLSYFEAPSCAFDGVDKIYTYSSFEIDTYPLEGKDFVSTITFKDDSITTPEGVGIGDAADKVKEVYGDCTEEGGMLVYEKDDMKLCFIVKDGAVVSVEYQSTILDE